MPVQISVRKLREGAKMPMSGSAQAAGYDLYACTGNGITVIAPHTTAMIGTGLAAAVPEGYFGKQYQVFLWDGPFGDHPFLNRMFRSHATTEGPV